MCTYVMGAYVSHDHSHILYNGFLGCVLVHQNKTYLDGILAMKNYKNAYYSVCLYIKFPCHYVLFHESYVEFCGFLCRLEPGAPGSEPKLNLPNLNLLNPNQP